MNFRSLIAHFAHPSFQVVLRKTWWTVAGWEFARYSVGVHFERHCDEVPARSLLHRRMVSRPTLVANFALIKLERDSDSPAVDATHHWARISESVSFHHRKFAPSS